MSPVMPGSFLLDVVLFIRPLSYDVLLKFLFEATIYLKVFE